MSHSHAPIPSPPDRASSSCASLSAFAASARVRAVTSAPSTKMLTTLPVASLIGW